MRVYMFEGFIGGSRGVNGSLLSKVSEGRCLVDGLVTVAANDVVIFLCMTELLVRMMLAMMQYVLWRQIRGSQDDEKRIMINVGSGVRRALQLATEAGALMKIDARRREMQS